MVCELNNQMYVKAVDAILQLLETLESQHSID